MRATPIKAGYSYRVRLGDKYHDIIAANQFAAMMIVLKNMEIH